MSRLWGGKKGKPAKPEMLCGFCGQPIVASKTHSGLFYSVPGKSTEGGGKIHSECWEAYHEKNSVKCLHCGGPIAHIPGRFNGKYFKVTDPPGQVHSECWEAFQDARRPTERCSQCSEPLCAIDGKFSGNLILLDGGVKLHEECRSAYHAAHTQKCIYCAEPAAPKKGKFSGEYYELEGKGRVHVECFESYSDATADPCIVCKEGIRKKGRFSGDFCLFEEKKCHKECASDYLEMKADKCLHCRKGVRNSAKFSGSYYPIERKGSPEGPEGQHDKVHMECWIAYEAARIEQCEEKTAA